jgi:hypothetical protein
MLLKQDFTVLQCRIPAFGTLPLFTADSRIILDHGAPAALYDYNCGVKQAPSIPTGLSIDRFSLPADERARI